MFLIFVVEQCLPLTQSSNPLFLPPTGACHQQGFRGGAGESGMSSSNKEQIEDDLSYIRKLIDRFKDLEVDRAELEFLKAVILFKADTRGLKVDS